MTRRRWIADRVEGHRAFLTGQNAAHLSRVLRAKPGQQFDIAAEGVARLGTIVSITADEVEFELGMLVENASSKEIVVLISIFKFDRLEWAVEKLTELGVTRIIPAIARRTEQHLAKAAEKRVERWRRISHEAAQQARRTAPPEIAAPLVLRKAIENVQAGSGIVLSEAEESTTFKSALAGRSSPVIMAFGPEGGWAPEELNMFREHGWLSATLGDTILRAETAVIAAVAIAISEITA